MFGITNPKAHEKQNERAKQEIDRTLKQELEEAGYNNLEDFKKEIRRGVPAIIFLDDQGYKTQSLSNIPFNIMQRHNMNNVSNYDALEKYPDVIRDIADMQIDMIQESATQYIVNTVLENLYIWLSNSRHMQYYTRIRQLYIDPSDMGILYNDKQLSIYILISNIRNVIDSADHYPTKEILGRIFSPFNHHLDIEYGVDEEEYHTERQQLINNNICPCIVWFSNIIITELYKKIQSDRVFVFGDQLFGTSSEIQKRVDYVNEYTKVFYGNLMDQIDIKGEDTGNFRAYTCFMSAFAEDLQDFLYNTIGAIIYNVYENAWKTGYFFARGDSEELKRTKPNTNNSEFSNHKYR